MSPTEKQEALLLLVSIVLPALIGTIGLAWTATRPSNIEDEQ